MPWAGPAVSTREESPQAELLLGQGWRLETRDDVTMSPSCPGQTCPKSLDREASQGPGWSSRCGDLGLNSLEGDCQIKEKGMQEMDKAILSCCVPSTTNLNYVK